MDAIQLLEKDHREVEALFAQFEKLDNDNDAAEKAAIAFNICKSLKAHTTIEEELFYPAARDVLGDDDLIEEAVKEHSMAKKLIADIEKLKTGMRLDMEIKALKLAIEHHVKEEETEMFPQLQERGLETAKLGQQMLARKQQLM
jgi:hemerythrin superfamily protein